MQRKLPLFQKLTIDLPSKYEIVLFKFSIHKCKISRSAAYLTSRNLYLIENYKSEIKPEIFEAASFGGCQWPANETINSMAILFILFTPENSNQLPISGLFSQTIALHVGDLRANIVKSVRCLQVILKHYLSQSVTIGYL